MKNKEKMISTRVSFPASKEGPECQTITKALKRDSSKLKPRTRIQREISLWCHKTCPKTKSQPQLQRDNSLNSTSLSCFQEWERLTTAPDLTQRTSMIFKKELIITSLMGSTAHSMPISRLKTQMRILWTSPEPKLSLILRCSRVSKSQETTTPSNSQWTSKTQYKTQLLSGRIPMIPSLVVAANLIIHIRCLSCLTWRKKRKVRDSSPFATTLLRAKHWYSTQVPTGEAAQSESVENPQGAGAPFRITLLLSQSTQLVGSE